MSTTGARDYRPLYHFTPQKGWINDPNGLVYDGETYHLFAQYYPEPTAPRSKYWLHATGDDLVHWTELGVAIEEDELGMIFSGSAIVDAGNTSGFGDGRDPIIAMFTHHGETEQQSIAHSTDGVNFTKYPGNPVIPNPGLQDFRDPKLFRNPVLNCWSVVVAANDRVAFYRSEDFIHWIHTGEFGAAENQMGGVFECPDLFPLQTPDGQTLWVLIVSMTQPSETGGNRTQYFLGEFDGYTFHQTIPFGAPVLLDHGYDNYAAVTFAGAPKTLLLGWASSWTYADQTPTGEYCGAMTLAREVALVDTDDGVRLACIPCLPACGAARPIASGGALPGEAFVLRVRAESAFEIALKNERGEVFRFGLDGQNEFFTDRSASGEMEFNALYNTPLYQFTRAKRLGTGPVDMTIAFDRCIFELFADNGAYANTTLVYPTAPYEVIDIVGATVSIAEMVG